MRKVFCNFQVLYRAVAEGLMSIADLDHGIFMTDHCGDYARSIDNEALMSGADPLTAKIVSDAFHKALLDGRVALWRNEYQGDLHKTLLSLNDVLERTNGARIQYRQEEVWESYASLYAICMVLKDDPLNEELDIVSIFWIQKERRKNALLRR